ncbi:MULTISPECIES: IclR family transcriptional regulator [Pseudomonas]|uniref:IclR family transcriptional regulator n=1 Tax=Pseudomonas asiatica TaxID=2219225 RepID=A0ABU5KX71_9PSED|nr:MULTISPECIES: IclR family transcriptional regulator [Pseudomonas]AGA73491.1 IclR family transcriptional regulator [Pseudomonas putida HB3267]MCE0752644.1 IclR family transcriptional regulator [Pseudomonas asiatica]MCE0945695.1 IclR family transcriptional regulator [Pseudomonas asiatica]MCE0952492.1 IclR family transcriptional regulator [Pseudomonas asiatica]MCE1027337.1 IclR family transcriptional regulator [Pseudomonas asiatica]
MTTRPFHLLEHGESGLTSPHIPGQGKAPLNRSLERGLDILRAFRPGSEHLTNGDLSEITGLSKSTVSRLTQTLVRSGFLDFDSISRGYRLAPSVLGMAHSMYHGSFLLQVATPLMAQVARDHQVNVGLAAADGDEMIYLESIRFSKRKSPRNVLTGQRLPMEMTSLGRAYLSILNDAQRRPLIELFRSRRCEARAEQLISDIEAAITDVENNGYCVASWQPEVIAIATPLNHPVYKTHALNISLSTVEAPEGVIDRYAPILLSLAESIRASLNQPGDE